MRRLIYFIPVWVFMFLITIPFHILGFVMIPLACIFKAYRLTENRDDKHPKYYDGHRYNFTWKIMWPWDNYLDGIANRNYYESRFERYSYLDMIVTTFVWSAVRNPFNNLDKWLSPKYDFTKLKHIGSERYNYKYPKPCWYLIWQGPYGGYYHSFNLFGKHRYIKLGYKLRPYPGEAHIPESQIDGVGMTFRIIPKEV